MALSKLPLIVCAVALSTAAPAEETQFVAAASPTHFEALNPNPFTVLLVLGEAGHGARAQMLVAPGASFETSFPSGTLDGLFIEIVFFSPAGRISSGAVSFESMINYEADLLEVDLSLGASEAWICTNGMRMPVEPTFQFVPSSLIYSTAASTEPLMISTAEVPVITPLDIDSDQIAPRIRPSTPLY